MPPQEPVNPGQIKPESCREPETSSRLQQTNANLQAPRNGVHGYILPAHIKAQREKETQEEKEADKLRSSSGDLDGAAMDTVM